MDKIPECGAGGWTLVMKVNGENVRKSAIAKLNGRTSNSWI